LYHDHQANDGRIQRKGIRLYGIRSIPTFLFIPAAGKPAMQPGALPKHVFKEVIDEHLVGEKAFE
jgi:predicted DsbA family dithiol-disulfide isomerase